MGKVIQMHRNKVEGGESDLKLAPLQDKSETVKVYTNSLERIHNGEIRMVAIYRTNKNNFENKYSIA